MRPTTGSGTRRSWAPGDIEPKSLEDKEGDLLDADDAAWLARGDVTGQRPWLFLGGYRDALRIDASWEQ